MHSSCKQLFTNQAADMHTARCAVNYAALVCRLASRCLTFVLLLVPMQPLMREPFHDSPEIEQYVKRSLDELTSMCEGLVRLWHGDADYMCHWPGLVSIVL
jgi:hypothetical protein